MNAVIPWAELVALVTPQYPTAGQGRPPLPLERMLRVYSLQQGDRQACEAAGIRYRVNRRATPHHPLSPR